MRKIKTEVKTETVGAVEMSREEFHNLMVESGEKVMKIVVPEFGATSVLLISAIMAKLCAYAETTLFNEDEEEKDND